MFASKAEQRRVEHLKAEKLRGEKVKSKPHPLAIPGDSSACVHLITEFIEGQTKVTRCGNRAATNETNGFLCQYHINGLLGVKPTQSVGPSVDALIIESIIRTEATEIALIRGYFR